MPDDDSRVQKGAHLFAAGCGDAALELMAGEIQQIAAIGGQSVGARAALGAHHFEKASIRPLRALMATALAFIRRGFTTGGFACMRMP